MNCDFTSACVIVFSDAPLVASSVEPASRAAVVWLGGMLPAETGARSLPCRTLNIQKACVKVFNLTNQTVKPQMKQTRQTINTSTSTNSAVTRVCSCKTCDFFSSSRQKLKPKETARPANVMSPAGKMHSGTKARQIFQVFFSQPPLKMIGKTDQSECESCATAFTFVLFAWAKSFKRLFREVKLLYSISNYAFSEKRKKKGNQKRY